jgi:predicted metal-dependent phosphotriesterase family hydrolase
MKIIRTVLGDIAPEQLGFTDAHEHLIMDKDYILKLNPDYRLDSVEKTAAEVLSFMGAGGRAAVEMTCLGVGRNAKKLVEVARKTGFHIIASTGFHRPQFYIESHWRYFYDVDQIARIFIEEIEKGMDQNQYNGPLIDRTEARAGVVKIATGYYVMKPEDERIVHAAAIAHRETGVPIFTHTEDGTLGLELVRILGSDGVDPAHITIGHYDRNPDFYLHHELAKTGCYLQYDTPSRRKYFPESHFVELVRKMVEAGHGKQILWGGDLARQSYQGAYGGAPGLKYVLEDFIPRMRQEGFSEDVIADIFVNNPARALAFEKGG